MGKFTEIFSAEMFILLVCLLVSGFISSESDENGKAAIPHWEDLECQPGHKYLFSEDAKTWDEARIECDLYGGWLVDIRDVHEQNCLMKHAKTSDGVAQAWYWTGANDFETDGIWMLASKADEVTFFGSKPFSCGLGSPPVYGPSGGHALAISFESNTAYNGRWCDYGTTSLIHYVCKAKL